MKSILISLLALFFQLASPIFGEESSYDDRIFESFDNGGWGRSIIKSITFHFDQETKKRSIIIGDGKYLTFEFANLSSQDFDDLKQFLHIGLRFGFEIAGPDYSRYGTMKYILTFDDKGLIIPSRSMPVSNFNIPIPENGYRHIFEWKNDGVYCSFKTEDNREFKIENLTERPLENGEIIHIESEEGWPRDIGFSTFIIRSVKDNKAYQAFGASIRWTPSEESGDRIFLYQEKTLLIHEQTGAAIRIAYDSSIGFTLAASVGDRIFVLNGGFYNLTKGEYVCNIPLGKAYSQHKLLINTRDYMKEGFSFEHRVYKPQPGPPCGSYDHLLSDDEQKPHFDLSDLR